MMRASGRILAVTLAALWVAWRAAAMQGVRSNDAGQGTNGPLAPPAPQRPATAPEPTKAYDSGNPTAEEQRILERINQARSDPRAEGQRLGIEISEGLSSAQTAQLGPKPPLAMNPILLQTARAHSEDMYAHNHNEHKDSQGLLPAERMRKAGFGGRAWAENIAWSTGGSAEELEDMLMVDKFDAGRGHRANLLDLNPKVSFREVGIGIHQASAPNKLGDRIFLTEDFGAGDAGPFLVGVAYADKNENRLYDVGEGLAGVRIQPNRGGYHAITGAAGGYALPIETGSGPLQVTASGGGLGSPMVRTARVADVSVKLDFVDAPRPAAP